MSVERAEVERIARLARLALDEAEVERLTGDMNDILEHATTLRELGHAARSAEEGGATPILDGKGVDRVDGGPGTLRDAALEAPGPPRGTRDAAAETPDPLLAPPEAFAPRTTEGFFIVPPPPGVTAEGRPDPGPAEGE